LPGGPRKRSSTAVSSVGCFFVSACINYLHQLHFFISDFPYSDISWPSLLYMSMMPVSPERTVVRPVTTNRTINFNVPYQGHKVLHERLRQAGNLLFGFRCRGHCPFYCLMILQIGIMSRGIEHQSRNHRRVRH
jgi:hypothetical protein